LKHVLLTRRIPSSVLSKLESQCTVDVYTGAGAIPREHLIARAAGKDALIPLLTDTVDAEVMDAAPTLEIVANIAVGHDNIDLAAARTRGVVVTNTPDVLTEATAEFTWALILGIARRIAEADRAVRSGTWKGWALDYMLGTELRGKQLGILGAGRIGRAVALKAPAFGMQVVFAHHPSASARGLRTMSFDELLVSSDVISLHAPLTASTRHLIDKRAFARMKRSALLVNTGRGSIIDEAALAWALQERLIAGAALDVYEDEPRVYPDLLQFDSVLLAPHIGSATRETRTAMAELAVRNVLAVLSGAEPLTPVTSAA
jgi:glyoxylate reductase